MNYDEIKAWAESLKPGDEVAVESGIATTHRRVGSVVRCTPKQVVVCDYGREVRYRKSGGRMCGGEWHERIRPLTDADRGRMEREALAKRMGRVAWERVSLDGLHAVAAVLDAQKKSGAK